MTRDLRSDYLKGLLDEYNRWTGEMEGLIAKGETRLFVIQLTLIGGSTVMTLGGGVILGIAMV